MKALFKQIKIMLIRDLRNKLRQPPQTSDVSDRSHNCDVPDCIKLRLSRLSRRIVDGKKPLRKYQVN
jgi:hypothetical protein